MKVYTIVEMADVELLGIRTLADKDAAIRLFNAFEAQNSATPVDPSEFYKECQGTIMLSGDDTYSVQLIESDVAGVYREVAGV